jgi:L-alanine-DL-glutamate epimerase-like enolase superfamily enzyme
MAVERRERSTLLRGEAAEEARAGLANRGLKVAKVDVCCLRWPASRRYGWITVRVETEEGIVGFGEPTALPLTPVYAWAKAFGDALIGESAWNIERIWTLQRDQYTHGSVSQAVLSAFDMAFWDIIGKKLNLPVYALLGGKINERIRIYHHPWRGDIESYEEFTERLVAQRITAGKLNPFRSQMRPARDLTSEEITRAIEIVQAIRDGGGDHFTLCIEMSCLFDMSAAVRAAKAMEPFNPLFIEEPVPATDVAAMREVQRSTQLAVALGECLRSTAECRPYLEQRACRILQPDIGHIGGITGLKRLAHMADDYLVAVAPHSCWGPVHSIATAHVCSTIPNFLIQEDVHLGTDVFEESVVGGYEFDPQYLDVPEAPGLGVYLSPELIREYECDPEEADIAYIRRRV